MTSLTLTERKIWGFQLLPSGWHYGEGVAADMGTVMRAITINRLFGAVGFAETDAFPGISGEVQVTAYGPDEIYLEFIVGLDGKISFTSERGDVELWSVDGLVLGEVQGVIEVFKKCLN